MKMELNEALDRLNKAGLIVEDKYMNDMDTELEEVGGQNKDLAELKKYAPNNIEIDGKNFRFEYDDRYTITGDSWYRDKHSHGFNFKLYDNKLNKNVTSKYNDSPDESFFIFADRDNYVNFGPVEKFIDTTIPFVIKEWEKKNRPGFFKRIFGKKNVQESSKNLISPEVDDLVNDIMAHPCFDQYTDEWDYYSLAEMGIDWLQEFLDELETQEDPEL